MTFRGPALGILGGTFNPIHIGHLRAAEEVAELFGLEKVIFIPAARPPHKKPAPVVDFRHRLAMVKIAAADRPGFVASDLEGQREGPSYTVETLRCLLDEFGPAARLFFLTGLDSFLAIETWKDFRHLFELTDFVVFTRPGADIEPLGTTIREKISPDYLWNEAPAAYQSPTLKTIFFRPVTMIDVSSTRIRELIGQGRSIRFLLPEKVRRYIIKNNLYQEPRKKGNEIK
ncbi:MAG: nicotinate-nucleotide adenylyltransferase [Pseudomonadota bacterium]